MKIFSTLPIAITLSLILHSNSSEAQLLNRLKAKVMNKVEEKVDQKADETTDDKENAAGTENKDSSNKNNSESATSSSEKPPLTVYSNYDFVPGDKILFDDNFADDQDGEFPAHWELQAGQAVLNKIDGVPAFCLTEGNYVRVSPRLKTASYLTDPFTVEFDYYVKDGGAPGVNVFLKSANEDVGEGIVTFGTNGNVSTAYFPKDFSADFPDKNSPEEAFYNKWHHAAFIYKSNQLKCYVDQYRVLVIPDLKFIPASLEFGGIGSQDEPVIFNNVRIASGGEMNMIGKKFTEAKIVTHGINFDVDKATIKPESMGTLNMVVQVLKSNPELKFEIDGHTDSTGDASHNLTLSQQRADAVKSQLVSMGIDASRLTTKGFGDSKPISDNDSPEGRANNRRVEFVKL